MSESLPNYDQRKLATPPRFEAGPDDPDAAEDWCECGHLHESHDDRTGQCRFCLCTGFIHCDPPPFSEEE